MSNNEAFKAGFARMIKAVGDKADEVVRKTALDMQTSMVNMSPVGDPTGWLSLNPYSDITVPGMKTKKPKTKKKAPVGYVGGTLRANWQTGIGSVNTDTSAAPDKTGNVSIDRTKTLMAEWKPGQTIFLTNTLPYAKAIEYGHSHTQAPQGMVRITVQNYAQYLAEAVNSVKGAK